MGSGHDKHVGCLRYQQALRGFADNGSTAHLSFCRIHPVGRLLPDVAGDLGQAGPDHFFKALLLVQDDRPGQLLQRLRGHLLLQQQPQQRCPGARQQQAGAQR